MAATIPKEHPSLVDKDVIKSVAFDSSNHSIQQQPDESDEFDGDDDQWLASIPVMTPDPQVHAPPNVPALRVPALNVAAPNVPAPNVVAPIVEAVEGFDYEAGRTWIYPDNMTVRTYQFHSVKVGLFTNSLIVLPTGFGKTFIAAVVMYNFYRWFPSGKIIFMAPTRPLVAQQIEECKRISGIPRSDTIELTGHTPAHIREQHWMSKRVFFVTPQVIQNDLANNILPAKAVRCIVIDEAHRAQGNSSYVEVIRHLHNFNRNGFRILALTATPGSDIKRIQQVVLNLFIGDVVFRSEESLDLMSFRNDRAHHTVVVPLEGKIKRYIDTFIKVCRPVVMEIQRTGLIFCSTIEKLSKAQLLKVRTQLYQHGPPSGTTKGRVSLAVAACLSLRYSYDLLSCYGIRPFYSHLKGIMENIGGTSGAAKAKLAPSVDCQLLLQNIEKDFGSTVKLDSNDTEALRTVDLAIGHPKLKKVEEIIVDHFERNKDNRQTRAIVFSKYRDSVLDISQVLSKHAPLVKPMKFVGQNTTNGKVGTTQKEQLEIVKKFREGGYNTLVATCVAEEGLDIGEIDLIVCYDMSASPISFIQRRGRTGRKRAGRVVILMTKEVEEGNYARAQKQSKTVQEQLYNKSNYISYMYKDPPRMVPKGLNPALLYLKIYSEAEPEPESPKKKTVGRKRKRKEPEDYEEEDSICKAKKGNRSARKERRAKNDTSDEAECSFKKAKDFISDGNEKYTANKEDEDAFDDDDDVLGRIFEEMISKKKQNSGDDFVEILD